MNKIKKPPEDRGSFHIYKLINNLPSNKRLNWLHNYSNNSSSDCKVLE